MMLSNGHTNDNYNIILTQNGKEVEFDFKAALAPDIRNFVYLEPNDRRCSRGIADTEKEMIQLLRPVVGSTYQGPLRYQTKRGCTISLHGTAILGYRRELVIDPRLDNHIATVWDIYIDKRVFPLWDDRRWLIQFGEIISHEVEDPESDRVLVEKMKEVFIREQKHEFKGVRQ